VSLRRRSAGADPYTPVHHAPSTEPTDHCAECGTPTIRRRARVTPVLNTQLDPCHNVATNANSSAHDHALSVSIWLQANQPEGGTWQPSSSPASSAQRSTPSRSSTASCADMTRPSSSCAPTSPRRRPRPSPAGPPGPPHDPPPSRRRPVTSDTSHATRAEASPPRATASAIPGADTGSPRSASPPLL